MDSIAWICISSALIPLLAFLSIKKPFVFPFGAYVFFLPFDSVLSITGSTKGATLTKLLGIMTIIALVFIGTFKNRLKTPSFSVIWLTLLIVLGVISASWAIQPALVLQIIPTAIGLLLLYIVAATVQIQKSEFETLKWFILVGGLIAAIVSIYLFSEGYFYKTSARATMLAGERQTNPNMFAFSLLLPVAVCIEMMLRKNRKMIRIFFGIILGVLVFSIIITGSRGGMLGIAILAIVTIYFTRQKVTLTTMAAIIGIILALFIPDFFSERWGRLQDDYAGGRLSILYVAWFALGRYWLYGAGLRNFPNAYSEFSYHAPLYMGTHVDSHNVYIEIFVELGIVGICLMIFAIINHYRLIRTRFDPYRGDQIMLKAVLLGMLVVNLSGTYLWTKSFWLVWMMIVMYRNVLDSEEESDYSVAPINERSRAMESVPQKSEAAY